MEKMRNNLILLFSEMKKCFDQTQRRNSKSTKEKGPKTVFERKKHIFNKIKKMQKKIKKQKKRKSNKNLVKIEMEELKTSQVLEKEKNRSIRSKNKSKEKLDEKKIRINKKKTDDVIIKLENYTSINKHLSNHWDKSKKSESALYIQSKVKSLRKPPILVPSKNQSKPKPRICTRLLIDDYQKEMRLGECMYCNEKIDSKTEPVLIFVKSLNKSFRDFLSKNYLKEVSRLGPRKGTYLISKKNQLD